MKIRRIATAAATVWVAIVVALALPVSQLRTVTTIAEKCCCPDPANCHCPPHGKDAPGCPQMKSCHRVEHDVVAPQLPAFAAPAVAIAPAPVAIVAIAAPLLAAPHASPIARRPDAPS